MADDAILTKRKKEILRGEVDMEEYADPENEIHKIRSMARRRSDSLIDEIVLLQENDHDDIVQDLIDRLPEDFEVINESNLKERVERLRQDIDSVEREIDRLPGLKERLSEIETELGMIHDE